MKNIFEIAASCLHSADVKEKLRLTHQARFYLEQGELSFNNSCAVADIASVKFPAQPEWLAPRFVPKRKLTAPGGVAAFFHAIAHIEFVAIYLAWDILYRFRGLPDEFYQDWLRIADEEAQHFELLRGRLREFDMDYGDLPAHAGLWGIATETAYDVLARMALVPRFMEARGLDVTPGMIAKLKNLKDTASVKVLERILHDEVGHVALGSYWFQWICGQRGLNPEQEYFKLIERHMKGQARGPFNLELRRLAGFSESELILLDKAQGFA